MTSATLRQRLLDLDPKPVKRRRPPRPKPAPKPRPMPVWSSVREYIFGIHHEPVVFDLQLDDCRWVFAVARYERISFGVFNGAMVDMTPESIDRGPYYGRGIKWMGSAWIEHGSRDDPMGAFAIVSAAKPPVTGAMIVHILNQCWEWPGYEVEAFCEETIAAAVAAGHSVRSAPLMLGLYPTSRRRWTPRGFDLSMDWRPSEMTPEDFYTL